MNELFNTPFDPLFAQVTMLIGTLILNSSGILFIIAALIHFVLKPETVKITAKRCLLFGIAFLFLGLLCLIPYIANTQAIRETTKNIRV